MAQFVGTHEGKLDGKNRISVPAAFRPDGERAGTEQLAFRLSHQRPCIEAQSRGAFDRMLASIARLPMLSEERDDFESALIAETALLRVDGEGRVILPGEMLKDAGLAIGAELSIVGKGERFEIWPRAAWKAHVAAARLRVHERRATLDVSGLNTTPQVVS
jgi:MraZ protein